MTAVKYQIFVSSTYEDLKPQRDQVVRAILEMGHIPVGMEMFSAGDESQWQLIQRQIEASDYYVVIIAHRYGSMDGTISYTEKEYDYAVALRIPALGFIIQDGASWPTNLVEKEPTKVAALSAFKEKVRRKIISNWNSSEDLHGKVSIALMKQITTTPRDGWIRASAAASPQLASELARLSQENGELRDTLKKAQLKESADQDALIAKTIRTLNANQIDVAFYFDGDKDWTPGESVHTLYDLFFLIAPEVMVERSLETIAYFIAQMWTENDKKKLRTPWPVPSNRLRSWIADLAALNLMEPSRRKHPVQDKRDYWTLTRFGNQIYVAIRRARLEAGLPTQPIGETSPDAPAP